MTKAELRRLTEENLRAGEAFARLLRLDGAAFSPREIADFARECDLPRPKAAALLYAALLGIGEDRRMLEGYWLPAIRCLMDKPWRESRYGRIIRFPEAEKGAWRFTRLAFAPYQMIPCGPVQWMADGREIPAVGYFEASFSYPAVLEEGREWMTVTPNEEATMAQPLATARGKIVVFGLGLGYFALLASQKPEVSSVTVIERDGAVISLFRDHLLPQFPHKEKLRIVEADAFDYAAGPMKKEKYDFAFVDLWHDAGDGLPLYLRMRRLAEELPEVDFHYWIESDLLLLLRGLMVEDFLSSSGPLGRLMPENGELPDFGRMRRLALFAAPEDALPGQ